MGSRAKRFMASDWWKRAAVMCIVSLAMPLTVGAAGPPADAAPATPESLVQQAIAAGVSGQPARKAELLAAALRQSPDFAAAHWQQAELRVGNRWLPLSAVAQTLAADPRIAEYRRRRTAAQVGAAQDGAAQQLALGKWCQAQGLADEARAHFTKVLELSPGDPQATAALQLKNVDGKWMTQEQIDRQLLAKHQADDNLKTWKPVLQALARRIEQGPDSDRKAAAAELATIGDPSAVGAAEAVCLQSSAKAGRELVTWLAAFPQQTATEALLRQAVLHPAPVIRSAANDALKSRSLHDYAPILIGALQAPLKTDLDVDVGRGAVRFEQTVRQEGATQDRVLRKELEMPLHVPNPDTSFFLQDSLAIAAQSEARANRQARLANQAARQLNDRIYAVLATTTGQDLDHSPRDWWDWWYQYIDYYQGAQRPTDEEYVHYFYNVPYFVSPANRYNTAPLPLPVFRTHSCFARGTKVWTISGPAAIETVQMGDRVLSQDPDSGELAYKPVLQTTLRPKHPTLKIQLGSDSLVVTRGHLFWVDPQGWKMARELQPGMLLHGLERDVTVDSVQEARIADVYNLVIADFGTYFVGQKPVLVHDNTLRTPTLVRVPGWAPAAD